VLLADDDDDANSFVAVLDRICLFLFVFFTFLTVSVDIVTDSVFELVILIAGVNSVTIEIIIRLVFS